MGALALCLNLMLSTLSCQKEESLQAPAQGSSTASMNDEPIDFQTNASLSNNERFFLTLWIQDRIEISLGHLPKAVGTYRPVSDPPSPAPEGLLSTHDFDVALDHYVLIDTSFNQVTITDINTRWNIISGTYALMFQYDTRFGAKHDGFPDTLVFEQGKFLTRYTER